MIRLVALAALLAQPAAPAPTWTPLSEKDGLRISRDTSRPEPTYRAEGTVNANLFEVMAVLSDIAKRPQWVRNLSESKIVSGDVEHRVVIYERYHLPWPCEDRDSVVESTIHVDLAKLEVTVSYHQVQSPLAPVRPGVVRMPVVRGLMRFRYLDATHASAQVILGLDVGGSLPGAAVRHFVSEGPVMTLHGLVKQVKATRGQYADFIRGHAAQARTQSKIPFEIDAAAVPAHP